MKKILPVGLAALALCVLAPLAPAQTQEPLKVYYLSTTGASGLSITNGAMPVTITNVTTVGATFPIWRGRGFNFCAGFYATNSSTANVNFALRFGNIHSTNGVSSGNVTNWSTTTFVYLNQALNGTTEVLLTTNIQPTVVDNFSLGQFYQVTNAHTATIYIDPTNTYVGVYP